MTKYTLYMGLNDKETKRQMVSTLEAYKIVSNLVSQTFDGGTIYEADGVYKHDDGTIVIEKTLKIELLFAEQKDVKDFCETLKRVFNQESIAVQREEINSELW